MTTAADFKQQLLNASQGSDGKERLSKWFHDGQLVLPLRSGKRIEVSEEDPAFEAKALLSLTVIRASFQETDPPLDERAAAEDLGLEELPSGFYVLSPETPPRIAAAYLAQMSDPREDIGSVQDESLTGTRLQWSEVLKSPATAASVTESALVCHASYHLESFIAARDPFADYMSLGQGVPEGERNSFREDQKNHTLQNLGISLWTQSIAPRNLQGEGAGEHGANAQNSGSALAEKEMFGYPSVARFKGIVEGLSQDEEFQKAGLRHLEDGSITTTLSQLNNLQLYNHDGSSSIANVRNYEDAKYRKEERRQFTRSIMDMLLSHEAITNGSHDETLRIDPLQPQAQVLRNRAARGEIKSLGKERKFFAAQGKTVTYKEPLKSANDIKSVGPLLSNSKRDLNECMIVSMDASLVDGQHSTRDYVLIVQGCLSQKRNHKEGVDYYSESRIDDCSPENLTQIIFQRAKERWQELEGQSPERRDPLGLGFEQMKNCIGNQKELGRLESIAKEKAFNAFKVFAPNMPVKINVLAYADAAVARSYGLIENTIKAQSLEDKALADEHERVSQLVSYFNVGAKKAKDPIRLTATKSLHANHDFSTATNPSEITQDLKDLYPFLRAVSDPTQTIAASNGKKLKDLAAYRKAAQWEAYCILAHESYDEATQTYQTISRKSPEFKLLEDRLTMLFMSVGDLKQRSFELNSGRLDLTLSALIHPEAIGGQGPTFAKFTTLISKRFSKHLTKQELNSGYGMPNGMLMDPHQEENSLDVTDAVDIMNTGLQDRVAPGHKEDGAKRIRQKTQVENEEQRADRIYAVVKAAIALKQVLRPNARGREGDNLFKKLMNDASMDNIMLSMLLTRFAMFGEHPASKAAAEALTQGKERVLEHLQDIGGLKFNSAREQLTTQRDIFNAASKSWPDFPERGSISDEALKDAIRQSIFLNMTPDARDILINAMPGKGMSRKRIQESFKNGTNLLQANAKWDKNETQEDFVTEEISLALLDLNKKRSERVANSKSIDDENKDHLKTINQRAKKGRNS